LLMAVFLFGAVAANAQKLDSASRLERGDRGRFQHANGDHKKGMQDGRRVHEGRIAGLTDEQQQKMKALHISFAKETLPLTNQLSEKQARLHTLQTADKVDLKAVNGTIDEIGKIRTELMKKRAAQHESIRQLLTDEQRVAFDTRGGKHGKGQGRRGGHRF